MIKHTMKTLSFAFVVLAASAEANETGIRPLVNHDKDSSAEVGCSTQAEVARGWEFQLELLEARMAAKPTQAVEVRGAIIVAPFPAFAPYRTDLPDRRAVKAQSADPRGGVPAAVDHESSLLKR